MQNSLLQAGTRDQSIHKSKSQLKNYERELIMLMYHLQHDKMLWPGRLTS